jgi:hypothetical protein
MNRRQARRWFEGLEDHMARNDLFIQLVKVWRNLSRTYSGATGIAYRDCSDSLARAIGLPAQHETGFLGPAEAASLKQACAAAVEAYGRTVAEALERARVVAVLDGWADAANNWAMGEGVCLLVRQQHAGQWLRRDYILADADGHDIEHGADFARAIQLAQNAQRPIGLYLPGDGERLTTVHPTAVRYEGPTPDAARAAAALAIEKGEV